MGGAETGGALPRPRNGIIGERSRLTRVHPAPSLGPRPWPPPDRAAAAAAAASEQQHSGIRTQPGRREAGAPGPWMSRSAAASVRRAGEGGSGGGRRRC